MLQDLHTVLSAAPLDAARADYAKAILDDNILGKRSDNTKRRSLRYLRELYLLEPVSPLFRGLRDLWSADPDSLPLLAALCALARDPLLRATAPAIWIAQRGDRVDSSMLAQAVMDRYPASYSDAVAAKVGRNAASSWTQSGHLRGRVSKKRSRARSTPAAVAYAFMIGHLADFRGQGLLATTWGLALDAPAHQVYTQAEVASKLGWIDLRRSGEVVEVGFRWLLRAVEA